MMSAQLDKSITILQKQRNFFLWLAVVSVLVNGILVLLFSWTLSRNFSYQDAKDVVTHIVPGALSEDVTVGKYDASDSYLAHMARVMLDLRLNNTPSSIEEKHKRLFLYFSIKGQGSIKSSLEQEISNYKSLNITTMFIPSYIKVNREEGLIRANGTLELFYGTSRHESLQKVYLLFYSYKNGVFLLEGIEEESNGDI